MNFRDLGGYQSADGRVVRWRKIMRSGHLADLTEADIQLLADMGLSQVHDFRRIEEQQRTPSQPLRVEFIDDYQMSVGSISHFWDYLFAGQMSTQRAHRLVVDSYARCIDDVAPAYRRLFRHLLDNSANSSLFHCSAGKDRTGMAAALILSALGVPRADIIDDYLLTKEHFDHHKLIEIVEQHLIDARVDSWQRSWLIPYCTVHEENILAFFDAIDERYGDVGNYLGNALQLSDEDIYALQRGYLQ